MYKFLNFKGFKSIVDEEKLKFSNLNEWKRNGDKYENYFSRIFDSEKEFSEFVNTCKKNNESQENIKTILAWFYSISMNTYALSLTKEENKNSKFMWDNYGDKCDGKKCPEFVNGIKNYGIKIEFNNKLYDELKEKNREFIFEKKDVVYLPRKKFPSISQILKELNTSEEKNTIIKNLLFFQKDDSYSDEAEYRYIITKIGMGEFLTVKFMKYAKDLDLTFDSFENNKERFFYNDSCDSKLLKGNIKEYIRSVEASPKADDIFVDEVRSICETQGLCFLGKTKIA